MEKTEIENQKKINLNDDSNTEIQWLRYSII